MNAEPESLGNDAWQAIEPIWDSISIYDDPGTFLSQFRGVSVPLQHLFATHWCTSEVCNGGFHQFFWNSTGVLAPEAVDGFIALGLPECAAILRDAMSVFGSVYPRDRSERIAALEQLSMAGVREDDLFRELDDRFYVALGDFSNHYYRLADNFARSNVR